MLQWHYRSRHPSLIEVSNEHFYEGKLVLFPSPINDGDADGLRSHRVEGAYDRGGKRHNAIEAQAVANAVAAHARNSRHRSLGVVTFSTAQRDQVTFWLDQMRRTDGALDEFMREGADEEFFVKNIENVQGDERDVIFISVGYGPRIAGAHLDSMAFGPISSEGGERRLNVLFTRARFRTEVFVSFASGDIDLARTRSAGARILKHFLSAAETGISPTPRVLERGPRL
jgi:superfamily I DNA and/or RNA helicase